MGETPNIGQDGGRALEMHREVHTGWESRKDALEKDTWTFMQGKAAKNCFISYTCFLCIWTIILFISMIIQCCFPDYTPYHKAFRRKYHEISIFVFWVFKPTLRLVELCLWLNFSHCATCKEISSKKDAHIEVFSLCLSAKYFCI